MISLYLDIMISFITKKVNIKKEIEQFVQSLTVLKNTWGMLCGCF